MKKSEMLKVFQGMKNDPYQKGIMHGGAHSDHLKEVADRLLWRDGFKKFTIEVQKESDDYHISFKVISRER